jgi:hypothetical protein
MVDQRLGRWRLLSLDRLLPDKLTMTQELIANMLGVRHGGRRGEITVLEQLPFECYGVIKTDSHRLLPPADQKGPFASKALPGTSGRAGSLIAGKMRP